MFPISPNKPNFPGESHEYEKDRGILQTFETEILYDFSIQLSEHSRVIHCQKKNAVIKGDWVLCKA